MKEQIISYLKTRYAPAAMILYGSYADGSNNQDSDFDALVITSGNQSSHDTSTVAGVALDVFVYGREAVSGEIDCNEFLQIHDGIIWQDTDGLAAALQEKVRAYIACLPLPSREENLENVSWCEKMLLRTRRQDPEGFFRWHWLLTDSLEIYCGICGVQYWGPKKSLRHMHKHDPEGYRRCTAALKDMDPDSLANWIGYLRRLCSRE